jgi:hypothetical protein
MEWDGTVINSQVADDVTEVMLSVCLEKKYYETLIGCNAN